MLFDDQETARLKSIISRQARALTAKEIEDVITAGRKAKPVAYDDTIAGMRQRYVGDQVGIVRQALREAYRDTSKGMPVEPVNFLRFFASQDAGAFRDPAQCVLVVDKDPIDSESAEAMAFADALDLDAISIDTLAPEVERICLTGGKACAVLVGWQRVDAADPGQAVAHVYWPHDVIALAHSSAPTEERALYLVALRQVKADSSSDAETWWVWSRDYEETADGLVSTWSPWQHCRISTDGKHASLPQQYGGRLPVSFCRIDAPAGGFWPAPDRDILALVDGLNVRRSNHAHVLNMQAHGQVAVSGTVDVGDLPTGPSKWVTMPPGTVASVLNYGADFAALAEGQELDLAQIGSSRGQSPDAYSTSPTTAVSGVSRMIANAPHEARLDELRPMFKRWLESSLLPIVIDVINLFSVATIPPTMRPQATLAKRRIIEDPKDLQERVRLLLDDGLISQARAAVTLSLYDDEAAAVAAGLSDQIGNAPTTSPALAVSSSPFQSTRETTAASVTDDVTEV